MSNNNAKNHYRAAENAMLRNCENLPEDQRTKVRGFAMIQRKTKSGNPYVRTSKTAQDVLYSKPSDLIFKIMNYHKQKRDQITGLSDEEFEDCLMIYRYFMFQAIKIHVPRELQHLFAPPGDDHSLSTASTQNGLDIIIAEDESPNKEIELMNLKAKVVKIQLKGRAQRKPKSDYFENRFKTRYYRRYNESDYKNWQLGQAMISEGDCDVDDEPVYSHLLSPWITA